MDWCKQHFPFTWLWWGCEEEEDESRGLSGGGDGCGDLRWPEDRPDLMVDEEEAWGVVVWGCSAPTLHHPHAHPVSDCSLPLSSAIHPPSCIFHFNTRTPSLPICFRSHQTDLFTFTVKYQFIMAVSTSLLTSHTQNHIIIIMARSVFLLWLFVYICTMSIRKCIIFMQQCFSNSSK